jgi:hypothetical protein
VVSAADRLTPPDLRAVRRFAERGGRVVLAGATRGRLLRELVDRPPRFARERGGAARPLASVPETAGVREVRADAPGVYAEPGGARPALGRAGSSVLLVDDVGRGRVALLAQFAPLTNRALADADDALLGLRLAGERGRRVAFAESVHGFGRASGLAALPDRWRWALGGLALAGLVLVASRARRLGPPEAEGRDLAPPRSQYALALAAALERTGARAAAVEPARERARGLLARRAGLGPSPSAEEIARAAGRLGLPDDERAALSAPPVDDAAVLATGRALARLAGREEEPR